MRENSFMRESVKELLLLEVVWKMFSAFLMALYLYGVQRDRIQIYCETKKALSKPCLVQTHINSLASVLSFTL